MTIFSVQMKIKNITEPYEGLNIRGKIWGRRLGHSGPPGSDSPALLYCQNRFGLALVSLCLALYVTWSITKVRNCSRLLCGLWGEALGPIQCIYGLCMLPYILEQPLIECYYGLCGENGRTLCNGGNPLGVNRKRKKEFQSDSDGKTNANQMSSTKSNLILCSRKCTYSVLEKIPWGATWKKSSNIKFAGTLYV